ncbi:hypothetical protein [Henriciella aquimarina]|uniref:hypothetical protein n=1 Tax=Henriciella aquimarina TaxID=545261 RepID=UPI00117B46C1|nr:hypothetical protein [Henriciella aquimarina]
MTRMSYLAIGGSIVALVAAAVAVVAMWQDLGVTMSLHGWIAYGLGSLGCLALSVGLFWLLFHSARSGHDDIERREDLDG